MISQSLRLPLALLKEDSRKPLSSKPFNLKSNGTMKTTNPTIFKWNLKQVKDFEQVKDYM